MHSQALISLSLYLLTASAVAIPFVPRNSFETLPAGAQTSYRDSSNVLDSLVAQSAKESSNMNTCPPSHPSKQCCMSITALASDITSEIGEFIPLLSDVKLSSLISLECQPMDADGSNEACLNDVMCCTGTGGSKSSLMKTCKSWDDAIDAKKKALDKNTKDQMEQPMSNNGTSSSATPVAASSTSNPNPSAAKVAKKHGEMMVHKASSVSLPLSSHAHVHITSPEPSSTAKEAKQHEKKPTGSVSTASTDPPRSTTISAPASLSTTVSKKPKTDGSASASSTSTTASTITTGR